MNANASGHSETTDTISIAASKSYVCPSRFVKSPKTYEGGFISSLGVAIGSAMMTARHSLSTSQTTVMQDHNLNSQDVKSYVCTLHPCKYVRANTTNDSLAEDNCRIYATVADSFTPGMES